jgi:2-hydroxy-3-oxopropionate reductase
MRVALIGVGVMGSAIAGRLLDRKIPLTVCNRSPEPCAALAARGAKIAGSPAEAARGADFIVLSLNTADIVEQVVFGARGIASCEAPTGLVVDMGSIDPVRTREFAQRLRDHNGMGWVDAPLSGGAPAAVTGKLTLMLGGDAADLARAEPLLSLLSGQRTAFGPPGSGQTAKLVNQLLVANAFVAVAEATRLAEKLGLDPARLPAALAGGRADSRVLQEFMSKMARRDYTPTGRIANMVKDLEAVEAVTHAAGLQLPMTRLATDLHRQLVAQGLGPADNAALMCLFDATRVTSTPAVDAIVVMGPSGVGKSTLARVLAVALEWPCIESDDLHPQENIAKMAAGVPLDDGDRDPWLQRIASAMRTGLQTHQGVVVACSALKRTYRDRLRKAANGALFVLPEMPREVLAQRLAMRRNHFMPVSLLDSQLAALEGPAADEHVLRTDGSLPTATQFLQVWAALDAGAYGLARDQHTP